MKLNLELVSSVKENDTKIIPRNITCSLCYYIAFNGKKCNNRKCEKVFCGECYQKQLHLFASDKEKTFKCPFCQTFSDYSNLSEEEVDYINSFKYYCNKSKNCKNEYTFNQIIKEHKHNNSTFLKEQCYICKKIISENDYNAIKCVLCDNLCCSKITNYNSDKKKDNDNFCIQRCFLCKLPICKFCYKGNNKNKIANFICDECNQVNKCNLGNEENAKNICIYCNNLLCISCTETCPKCNLNFCKKKFKCFSSNSSCNKCISLYLNIDNNEENDLCPHLEILNCEKCFKKCSICKNNASNIKCNCCNNDICIKNCGIKCKCNYKSNNILSCINCTLICSICKKLTCLNCSKFCDECDKYNTLISCKVCNSNTIKKCQKENCNTNLCINCWNPCNYCGIIFCSNHSNACSNCEDMICNEHYTKCDKCLNSDELTYIKLCLKKCNLKCSFCNNTSTILCKEKNHKDDFVQNFGCKHNICNSCIKKCENCGKIVRKC